MYKVSTQVTGELLFIAPLNHLQIILGLHDEAVKRIVSEVNANGSCTLYNVLWSGFRDMTVVITKE